MKQAQKHFLKTERRHHPRYSVLEFECTVFCQGIQNPNRLINIGLGGLSFQVLSRMEEPADFKAVDILCIRPDRLYLAGIDCRMIYDVKALLENQSFSGAETRNCGVQFLHLYGEQKQALVEFFSGFDASQ
jgi:hypothetical protein